MAAVQPTSVKQQQQTITVVKNDVIRPVLATEPMMIKKTTQPEPLKAMRPPNQKIEVVEPPPPPSQKETTTAAEKPLMNKMNGISGTNAKTAPATPNEQADKSPLLPPRLSASLLNPPTQKGPRAGLPNKLAATLMSPPPQAWEKHFPLDDGGNELLDVIVQHSATSGFQSIHWVQLAKHESECTKLLQGINRLINEASKPCEATDIVLNRVYAVPFDEVFYRAVCLRPLDARNVATFRLIDYGNEVSVPLAHIHPSNPLMCNLNAFAFQIMLQPDRPIEIGEQLRIKLVKEQATENGIYMVEEEQPAVVEKVAAAAVVEEAQSKLVPIEKLPLPLDVETKMYVWDLNDLMTSGRVVVSVLDTERIRFIQERMPAKLHEYCSSLSSMKMYWPAVGEICLAVFDDDGQWYRAECIDRDEKSEMLSLLFVDYGNTTMTHSKFVRPISDEIRALSPVIVHNCTISGKFT